MVRGGMPSLSCARRNACPVRLSTSPITEEQKAKLRDADATILNPEVLDCAIVDVEEDEHGAHAVYDYDKLVEVFRDDILDTSDSDEPDLAAIEWVDYNTLRALPYMPEPRPRVREPNDD